MNAQGKIRLTFVVVMTLVLVLVAATLTPS